MIRVVGYIPARLQSTRLPRKVLLAETGKPLIQHTWEAAARAKTLDALVVATDSAEIAASVGCFGGHVEMTGEQPTGTDRIAEVVRRTGHDTDIVVNIQADEPEFDPGTIDSVVQCLIDTPRADMATAATPIREAAFRNSQACVKVVCALDGRALYFSRSPIPSGCVPNDARGEAPWLLHLGLYAYRSDFLLRLSGLPRSPLECAEALEQLRALEYGATIQVVVVDHHPAQGIDTADAYARFVTRWRARS